MSRAKGESDQEYSAKRRKYREDNKDIIREKRKVYRRKFRKDHPEIRKADWLRYKTRYPDKIRMYNKNYKHRKRGAKGKTTVEEWGVILGKFNNRCAYCGIDGHMTMDHVIPIIKGGTNWPSNIVPACKSCNSSKGTKDLSEFMPGLVLD